MAAIPFESPSCYWVAGSTGSGKSRLVARLIRSRKEMFRHVPAAVHYAYKEWQPVLFGEMQEKDSVQFHEGLPSIETIKSWSRGVHGRHLLLILDDLQHEVCASKETSCLFSVLSHHCNISVVFVVQNLYPKSGGGSVRDLFLNVHYVVLLSSKRDKLQVSNLARQVFPGQNRFLMSAYEDAVSSRNFQYLVIDLHPSTSRQYMVRANIFPGELTWVYQPE